MASLHPTSNLARTRSARLPPNAGKPAQSLLARTPSSSSAGLTPLQPPTTTANPSTVSNVALFLTNLGLLNLDRHPDWPDISPLTFSSRDAAQGQKKRIQCVEWALYHLFALWDHDEARNKLQPFFPPLDQVQSLNLRAALLRSLEQAKKNGVLGRDAVVRKTMLDECKGERLEEVLAVFSSAVLKKLVAEHQLNGPQHPALAQTLALENRGYSGERTELIALILAHKASLHRSLDDKNAARARFIDFSNLLELKDETITRRREQAEAMAKRVQQGGEDISDDAKLDIWRTVRNNWSGNERWMEALLYGDSGAHKDGVLSTPFDRVWRLVQAGRLAELEEKSGGGLIEQLDTRVRNQKERLGKWQGFRQRMFGTTEPKPAAKETDLRPRQRGIDLGFRAHENIHFSRMSPRKLARSKPEEIHGGYSELVSSLKAELAKISPEAPKIPSFFLRPREAQETTSRDNIEVPSLEPEAISELSDLEDEILSSYKETARPTRLRADSIPQNARTVDLAYSYPSNGEQPAPPRQLRRSATLQAKHSSLLERTPDQSPARSPARSYETRPSPPPRSPPQPVSPSRFSRSPPRPIQTFPQRAPSRSPEHRPIPPPTRELADQILASVNAASPSPVKKPRHTLSLAERTRLSMTARRTSHAVSRVGEEDDADEEIDPLPIKRVVVSGAGLETDSTSPSTPVQRRSQQPGYNGNGNDVGTVVVVEEEDGATDGYEDLVARTRRSMAGFEAARQKAQLERRRSLRKSKQFVPGAGRSSFFPAVDEEENTTLVLTEELISGEHDYDAVFMSRPKIKTSPVGTPTRGAWDD
ncbi:HAUS augmin-like complex subunit 6 N-terminus-domain-containing protein [Podospora didyma]|uniref:HAUS augmin-like complex subunit 6 N-terminus-domain-containing protein n=1 Tax=Podospora didyma TaxID=330526 RepID=A0AAE0NYR3_9PEZI|nr:HAUS augmin-like complex subunit 6 N-terminus-domain-containing protein [Podospora didyma]